MKLTTPLYESIVSFHCITKKKSGFLTNSYADAIRIDTIRTSNCQDIISLFLI